MIKSYLIINTYKIINCFFIYINSYQKSHLFSATYLHSLIIIAKNNKTITENVPDNALSVARAKQTNKENWVNIKKPYKRQHGD